MKLFQQEPKKKKRNFFWGEKNHQVQAELIQSNQHGRFVGMEVNLYDSVIVGM